MSDGVAARGLPRLLRDRILLGAILILALVVRLHTLSARPLWEDEAWSLSFIYLDNPWQIVDFGLRHFHPPLLLLTHYLVYWLNAHMVATTPVGLRAPSVLIGVLAIAAIYQAGATLLTREAGLIAALFSSVNVLQTIHSQEMRMYPLFLLLSWLSIILLANASRSRTIMSWILYGAATFLLIYTHNYAIFVLAAQTIYLLIGMPPGWPARISRVAGIWAFWAVAYAPAIALLLRSVRRHDVLHGGVYQAATLSSLLGTYEHLTVSTGSTVIFLTLIVPFILFGARRALAMQEFRAAGATAIFLAMTPMLIWCMSPPIPFGRERYFIFSAPALLLLLAFGLVAIRPIGLRLLVIGVMLVASIPALFFYYTSENPRAANDQAAAYVRSQRHPAEPILVGNGLRSFSYYYADEFPRVGSEEWSSFVVRCRADRSHSIRR